MGRYLIGNSPRLGFGRSFPVAPRPSHLEILWIRENSTYECHSIWPSSSAQYHWTAELSPVKLRPILVRPVARGRRHWTCTNFLVMDRRLTCLRVHLDGHYHVCYERRYSSSSLRDNPIALVRQREMAHLSSKPRSTGCTFEVRSQLIGFPTRFSFS